MNIIEEKQKEYLELISKWKKIKRIFNLALIPVGLGLILILFGLTLGGGSHYGNISLIATPSYWFLWLIVRLVFIVIVQSDINKCKRELDNLKIQLFPTQYAQQTTKQEKTQFTKCSYCGYETPVQFKKCSHCGAVL